MVISKHLRSVRGVWCLLLWQRCRTPACITDSYLKCTPLSHNTSLHIHSSVRLLHQRLYQLLSSSGTGKGFSTGPLIKTMQFRHKVCTAVKGSDLNESRAWPCESHWKSGCEIDSCCAGLPMAALTFSWMSFLHRGLPLCQSQHTFVSEMLPGWTQITRLNSVCVCVFLSMLNYMTMW